MRCQTTLNVDDAVCMFYDLVHSAMADFIPMFELRKQYPPWFDRSVRDSLRVKEDAQRRKKSSPTPENIDRHRTARSEFKSIVNSKYRAYLYALVRDFKDNPKRYWSFLKCLKSSSHVSPVLEHNGSVYKGDVERANCLNECFSRKFSNPAVHTFPEPPLFDAPGLSRFTVSRDRVVQLLRDLREHKACGPDGLSARVLKECADELSIPIHMLCELSVSSGTFPTMWKQANVIPVHKKGSKKLPDNYRPVSLLPICSKILEKVVCESLLPACLPALPSSQHGFLPKRSCVTNRVTFFPNF